MRHRIATSVLTIAALALAGCGGNGAASGGSGRAVTVGSVKVTLGPTAAVTAGATWMLDSNTTGNASGMAVSNIATGTHTIAFKPVLGYTTPARQTITVTANQTTSVTGTYVAGVGALKVTLGPAAAVTAGAKWTLDTSTTTRASGATVTGLPVGTHVVKFTPVTGYVTPADQTVTVTANQTLAVTGTYVAVGGLKVTLGPTAAIGGGAKWMLDTAATPYSSGATITGLGAGAHTLRFAPAIGYATPANQTVTVVPGATTSVTVTYVRAGSLKITILPATAVNAGAKWSLDSVATTYPSATTVSAIAIGAHTVNFTTVAGFVTPANLSVTITAGGTTNATATYAAAGSVKVTLVPAAAIAAGAKWTIDSSTTANASGAVVGSLAAGTHTIRYTAATGYITPASQTVTVTAGSTLAVSRTYAVSR
ncbi:MAG: hypothetical protein HZB16_14235 [Armatimonadetes bacterium]|nr:hypothetical protein [Armatimonadota bacterium]